MRLCAAVLFERFPKFFVVLYNDGSSQLSARDDWTDAQTDRDGRESRCAIFFPTSWTSTAPCLSGVRMVEEGSHAQRGNIRSGDHITSAAPQEKEGAKNNRFLLSNNKALFPFSSLSPSPGIRTRSIVAVQWGGACLPHKDQ